MKRRYLTQCAQRASRITIIKSHTEYWKGKTNEKSFEANDSMDLNSITKMG